jgi:hypothetical protein
MKAKTKSAEEAIFGQARWIWPDNIHWDLSNIYSLFRRTFELKEVPARAPLFITADQSYRLFINGRFVARGPARGFQSHWPYDEIDVRPFLKKGENLIAIRAHHPGRSTFQYISQGFAGVLVALKWGRAEVVSNTSWKVRRQTSASRDTAPVSVQLFCQEHIDLRKEEGDWTQPGFDDSAWAAPIERLWNMPPWYALEPRGIPLLVEKEIEPVALLGAGEGTSAPGYEDVRDVIDLRVKEDRGHVAGDGNFRPLTVASTERGKFRSYLFDFGRTVVGHFVLEVEGAVGGEIIDGHYVETIDAATLVADQTPNYCRVSIGHRLVCRPGAFRYSFYHHYGFRYLELTVRDATAGLRLRPVLNWTGYPLERKGSFASSDTLLEKIWETCAWTQQCCSLDAYVDTPWREQAQWWGDARVQAWNTFHLNGDTRLFRRGIAQIAGQTTPDGVTYGHSPTMAHECVLPDFTLIWFLTLWDYYWQTGSIEPLLAHEATIEKALEYFQKHTDPRSGLITYDDRFWLFLDWTDIFKDGAPTVYNLWLLISLEKLALLYRKAKKPRAAARLEAWTRKLRVSLGKLVNKEGLIYDGVDRKGKIFRHTCIHSQTLALQANLRGMKEAVVFEKILLPFIRGEVEPKVTPSAYWITYVFTLLEQKGFGEEVVAMIRRRWLPMVEHGTTWENFAPIVSHESFSHAWSAHPLYHFMQIIGGITQTAPKWDAIRFRPVFIGEHNETVVPTPHGPITARWRKKGATVDVELKLPRGIVAQIELPGVKKGAVTKGGKWKISLEKK